MSYHTRKEGRGLGLALTGKVPAGDGKLASQYKSKVLKDPIEPAMNASSVHAMSEGQHGMPYPLPAASEGQNGRLPTP